MLRNKEKENIELEQLEIINRKKAEQQINCLEEKLSLYQERIKQLENREDEFKKEKEMKTDDIKSTAEAQEQTQALEKPKIENKTYKKKLKSNELELKKNMECYRKKTPGRNIKLSVVLITVFLGFICAAVFCLFLCINKHPSEIKR
ncbi:hypothetical protein CDIK_3437 [Cucumispora dikerogammari]|nr:hypothetical protein CDIK_3437 [Cucumispora dikerogammari]